MLIEGRARKGKEKKKKSTNPSKWLEPCCQGQDPSVRHWSRERERVEREEKMSDRDSEKRWYNERKVERECRRRNKIHTMRGVKGIAQGCQQWFEKGGRKSMEEAQNKRRVSKWGWSLSWQAVALIEIHCWFLLDNSSHFKNLRHMPESANGNNNEKQQHWIKSLHSTGRERVGGRKWRRKRRRPQRTIPSDRLMWPQVWQISDRISSSSSFTLCGSLKPA